MSAPPSPPAPAPSSPAPAPSPTAATLRLPPAPAAPSATAQTVRAQPTTAGTHAAGVAESATASTRPTAARRRLGKFELYELLGQGGMGRVYKAYDTEMKRTIALKVILGDAEPGVPGAAGEAAAASADGPGAADEDQEQVRRFLREAQTAGALRHPHIVSVHEVGTVEGKHFFSMDLIEGAPLDSRIREHHALGGPAGDPPGLRRLVEILRDVARAIEYAHTQGVIHRDLKPQNILVDRTGHAYVADFGLAKRLDSASHLTATGAIMGTPYYMSPEQATGNSARIGPPADLYSLGVILYEVLAGVPPFRGANAREILVQVLLHDPVPPGLLVRE
ncbi:MAG: serine/threonine protein kinase, partial [Planctomycetes bacterium]|nr:serine/threonine protein kinase [Planctomycetota bacterium]